MIVTNAEGIVEISGLSSGGTTAEFNRREQAGTY